VLEKASENADHADVFAVPLDPWSQRAVAAHDEIDLHPSDRDAPPEEETWLSALQLDAYVPIHAQDTWIGLLGIRAKTAALATAHDAESDRLLLCMLADRTAAPLENTRLVDDLRQAKAELERSREALLQAYSTLEQQCAYLTSELNELEAKDRLKSGFIGTLDDRLRTPFANLSFAVQLLERHGVAQWSPDQKEQLVQIKESIGVAKQMADNVVTLATLLNSYAALSLQKVDMAELAEDAIGPLCALAQHKEIDLCTELAGSIPPILGDRERLMDAVYHLVHNALAFTAPGGQVTVRCWREGDLLRFNVHDTGIGVPADELPGLWLNFQQAAALPQQNAQGLGLGLALAYLVVEAHGGKVHAASEQGAGSDFGFCLPLEGSASAR